MIIKTHPQAQYSDFTSGYKHKLTFFVRTIKNINIFLSLVEKIIKEKLIPVLFSDLQILDELQKLIALPCQLGGTGIINPLDNANSCELSNKLKNAIIQQEHRHPASENEIENRRSSK